MQLRKINKVIIHCSATKPTMDIDAEWIRRVHVDENGWDDIGYHYVIKRDGTIERGRSIQLTGAHAQGYNRTSLGVCLVGGMAEDGTPVCNFTAAQYQVLHRLKSITIWSMISGDDLDGVKDNFRNWEFIGHCDLPHVNKTCPNFDVKAFFS